MLEVLDEMQARLQILAAHDHKTYGKFLKRNSLNWLELVQAVLKPAQRSSTLATVPPSEALTEMVCELRAKCRLLHLSGAAHRQRVQENHGVRNPPFHHAFR